MKYVCHVLLCINMCSFYLNLANCFSKDSIIFLLIRIFKKKKSGNPEGKQILMTSFDKIITNKFDIG